jgi:hypothetical protein
MQEFVALLQALAGEHLRALAVIGELGRPPIRNVVVLDEIDLDFVRQLGAQGASLGRLGVQAPLLMTPEYIRASLDAFPIELLEIQQSHLNLLGDDFFAPLVFKKTDVRLELERELKREVILIRQGVLSAGDRARVLVDVHAAATEQTLRLLRAFLWLHDRPAPASTAELVRVAGELTGLDVSAFAAGAFGRTDAFRAVETLYETVIALGNRVDRLTV